jgi:hypothetical protein
LKYRTPGNRREERAAAKGRSWLVALVAASALSACTIDLPSQFFDAASSPVDSGTSDTAPPTDTTPADVADVADTGGLADVDAGVPDATLPDTALPDAAAPDIVQPDIDQPDGGCISDEQCEPLVPLQLCQVARCENGLCVAAPAADGEVCDDPKVDPGPCAQEECAAAKCRLFQLDSGTPCGETDACLEDQCNASGVCVAIPVIDCNDDNPCTADSCHPETGCSHTPTQGGAVRGAGGRLRRHVLQRRHLQPRDGRVRELAPGRRVLRRRRRVHELRQVPGRRHVRRDSQVRQAGEPVPQGRVRRGRHLHHRAERRPGVQ